MRRWCGVVLGLALASPAWACGPWLSTALVGQDDAAVLAMPIGELGRELQRLVGEPDALPYPYVPDPTWEIEAGWRRVDGGEEAAAAWLAYRYGFDRLMQERTWSRPEPMPRPEGLGAGFDRYLDGAEVWHAGRLDEACAAFSAVLGLPEAERREHTVAARYMLARCDHQRGDFGGARRGYAEVRGLVDEGRSDPHGLALATIGWEAQISATYDRDLPAAIKAYAQLARAGDPQGLTSIRQVLRDLVTTDPGWTTLVSDPFMRGVVSAWLVSLPSLRWDEADAALAVQWLEAHEAAGVTGAHDAAHLAWLAWQGGAWELCDRWLDRADDGPLSRWLRARLAARAGQVDDAATRYRAAVQVLNEEPRWTLGALGFPEGAWGSVDPAARAMAELGVVELSRGRFMEALEAFEAGRRWLDLAYLAERVLTVEELRGWVDARHPSGVTLSNPTGELLGTWCSEDACPRDEALSARIRHLLARRLVREGRVADAVPYLPPDLRGAAAKVAAGLAIPPGEGEDKQAARALWDAAVTLREQGMELRGTDLFPDGAVYDGSFAVDDVAAVRAERPGGALGATTAEIGRAARHRVDPDLRFHYRHHAAALARRAASRMPADSEERVRMLCVAGRWLAGQDPSAADVFYKAMVDEGWNTALGREADGLRWFPECSAAEVDVEGARSTVVRATGWGCAQAGGGGWLGLMLLAGLGRRRSAAR
jgi:tetratricopeptide (TPR) repeat protein